MACCAQDCVTSLNEISPSRFFELEDKLPTAQHHASVLGVVYGICYLHATIWQELNGP
jgi:hypothetical protein